MGNMKGVFVIIDGASDEPCSVLGERTPLETAKTPNLDELAKKSRIDYCYTVKEGVAPESSAAIVSLLGYEPNFSPRGPIEARGQGIKLKNGDLAFRCNFGTLDNLKDLNILDRRAGRTLTTEEARILAKAVNERVKLQQFKFEFYPGIQHRGVLVIRGGFSDNISNVDPAYGGKAVQFGSEGKLPFAKPLDDEEDSRLAAELVNSFVRQSFEVLDKHPINLARTKKGLYPANVILCRDAGNKPTKFKKLAGKWMALGYMPLEIGVAGAAGMEIYKFKYPKLKGIDVYGNLYDGLEEAIKYAKKMLCRYKDKSDYFYIHFKETDVPGHDNKPLDKVKMIEILDKDFFSFLKDFIRGAKLIVTADHTTACRKKMHTAEPVPVLTYPQEKGSEKRFTEKNGLSGRRLSGRNLLKNNLFGK
jgi:2,3-bisphosphoglycerate-independent phosphoglycerate mutase